MNRFPKLEVNLDAIKQNSFAVCSKCNKYGIDVAGVIKFSDADVKIAKAYLDGGCSQIAVSRASHLKKLKNVLPSVKTLLLRAPMKSELSTVVNYADLSLHSDIDILRKLNKTAKILNKKSHVILMLDVGDLREGVETVDELVDLANKVELDMKNLQLDGIGTGFACLSGVLPDKEKLEFLVSAKRKVEEKISRKLPILSAGSSINMLMLKDGTNLMPKEINHLRIGGFIANPINMKINRGVFFDGMREDSVTLSAEIIEIREKNSAPKNSSTKNWSGETICIVDKGRRIRAILAIGSQDIGNYSNLIPIDDGIKLVGGSSDHTVIDVTDCKISYKSGDVITFKVRYPAMLYSFSGKHVKIKYVNDEK